jgi:hypothetical protein
MSDDRILDNVKTADPDDLADVIREACRLQYILYADHTSLTPRGKKARFALRKALEGLFGLDIPEEVQPTFPRTTCPYGHIYEADPWKPCPKCAENDQIEDNLRRTTGV